MARGINKVILVGNLGNDPDVKYTQGGMAVTTISLATSSVRKDKEGNQQERTEWHRVKLFGKLGDLFGRKAVFGIAVLVSTRTSYPLIRTLLYNDRVLDVRRVNDRLEERGLIEIFELRLLRATYFLAGTFFFSSLANYTLAKWIVVSPAGTAAFNEELGRMTLLSYPVIAIPSMVMMMAILFYLWRTIHGLTGLKMEDIVAHPPK